MEHSIPVRNGVKPYHGLVDDSAGLCNFWAVGEPMDQPRIAVEGEDDMFVLREEGVGRQIHAHDGGFFVHDMIDEARILKSEPVVHLLPDMRRQQVVQ